MSWLLSLGAKLKGYAIAILGVLATIGVAMLWAFRKGSVYARDKQSLADTKETLKETQQSIGVRNEIDTEVQKLPEAGLQSIKDAPSNTAAGQLRDDGWVRSDSGKD